MRFSAVVVSLLTIALVEPVQARDRFTDTFGGNGGSQQYILRCPAGTLITGVRTKFGAYINNLRPICNGQAINQSAGTDGGTQGDTVCPDGSYAFKFYFVALRSDNHLLKDVGFVCVPFAGGSQTAFVGTNTPGAMTDPIDFLMRDRRYPSKYMDCGGERIVGFQGHSGSSIDQIGLICSDN